MSASRQRMLLGILGVLLLIVAWQYLGPSGDSDGGGASRQPAAIDPESAGEGPAQRQLPGARRARTKGTDDERPVELRLADLAVRPHEYKPGRDPFSFREPPPKPIPTPPPPPPPSKEELERQRRLQEEMAERARLQAIEDAKPKPPPFPYSFMGTIGPANHRIAAFSDGKTQILAEEGEVLPGGQFIVAHIGYESVDIKFVNFPNEPPIRKAVGR